MPFVVKFIFKLRYKLCFDYGSKMRRTAKKFQVFGLGIFLSIAKAMVYHQRFTVVSHQSVRTVYHHALACINKAFAMMICNGYTVDDIQNFVLMICNSCGIDDIQNFVLMIYNASHRFKTDYML